MSLMGISQAAKMPVLTKVVPMSFTVSPRDLNSRPSEERTKYSRSEMRKLAEKVRTNGFPRPVIIDERGYVIAGWDLVLAANHLGWEVPVRRIDDIVGQGGSPFPLFR